jgi:putative two-component system response regulator
MSPVIPTQDMKILIVDDNPLNIEVFRLILCSAGYEKVDVTSSPRETEDLVRMWEPDLLVLDLQMPELSGYEVLAQLRHYLAPPCNLPVLVVSSDEGPESRRRALSMGARDFLAKPVDSGEAISRVRNLLQTRRLLIDLDRAMSAQARELEAARWETVERLAMAARYNRGEDVRHGERVADTSALVARAMSLDSEWIQRLRRAAPLHDLGKIAIPDAILLKPGALTASERATVEHHTQLGAEMLAGSSSPLLELASEIALCHHERWDGTGYPAALRGEAIPLGARIVAVAEVFDELTHDRPYREAWPASRVLDEIERGAGTQFDPGVVAVFLSLYETPGHRAAA